MPRLAKRLTYGNVVATLALFLALSGGAVWAAGKITSNQIGKGAVKNKTLAKSSVKAKNLAKKAVTAPKLANGAVKNAAIADGVVNFAKLEVGTNVVASATTPMVHATQEGPVPFNPPLSATSVAGEVLTLHLEAHGTLIPIVPNEPKKPCVVIPVPVINGNPRLAGLLLQLVSGIPIPGFTNGVPTADINFPIGLTQPGVPQNITMFLVTLTANCDPSSTVQISGFVTQEK
jgi:hypothetical protein